MTNPKITVTEEMLEAGRERNAMWIKEDDEANADAYRAMRRLEPAPAVSIIEITDSVVDAAEVLRVLEGLNAAIDAFWNDPERPSIARMRSTTVQKISVAQDAARALVEKMRAPQTPLDKMVAEQRSYHAAWERDFDAQVKRNAKGGDANGPEISENRRHATSPGVSRGERSEDHQRAQRCDCLRERR